MSAFSVFLHFSRQTFLTIFLSFFISLLSFLRLIFLVLSLFLHFFFVSDFSELIVVATHFAPSLSSFLPHFQVCSPFVCFFPFWLYCILLFFTPIFFYFGVVYFSLMVDYAEFRHTSPSIAFLFACLGGAVRFF